ncbi:MAG: ferrous iron transporter B [Coriobacteriia bacterium]|nr:ferrous iron transporter B [Coriobacteriia bacterium]
MRLALIGNPNSGKTTLYNALTGRTETVGNWSGVTVDRREHPVKTALAASAVPDLQGQDQLVTVDLPGAYSLSPYTSEEGVTADYVRQEQPDVIVNVVDSTNLSRGLFLTTQLLELGVPVVVALNKADAAARKGVRLDLSALQEALGCPAVEVSATNGSGLAELLATSVRAAGEPASSVPFAPSCPNPTNRAQAEEADRERFAFVDRVVADVEQRAVATHERGLGDAVDDVLTNRWLGLPIFVLVMFAVFQISQGEGPLGLGKILEGLLTGAADEFQAQVAEQLAGANPVLQAVLVDGVIGGVSAVLGFLPLVMVMYFLLALLEDCGYLARVAVVLDPLFKRVGLSGKSVIPFVITVGCAVPGIMSSRTIRDERERRTTALLASFMPCGAKIPVIALFAGAFFDDAGWVSTLMYFSGIALIFLGAWVVTRVTGHRGRRSFFVVELPEYKVPSVVGAFKSMCARGWAFVVKAATVILLCNMLIQLMQTFTWTLAVAPSADQSILASLAGPFAYLLIPIVGVCSWQLAAAAITGFIAKENVVGTLAVCFVGLQNLVDPEELALMEGAGAEVAGVLAITKVAALAYLMFVLYTPPCFAALGALRSELKSAKWFWGGVGLQLGTGYTVAYLVYTGGTLLTGGALDVPAALAGLAAVLCFAGTVAALAVRAGRKAAAQQVAAAAGESASDDPASSKPAAA